MGASTLRRNPFSSRVVCTVVCAAMVAAGCGDEDDTPPPAITVTSLPDTTQTAAYSEQLTSSGGSPPVTWTVTAGALPVGLSLSADGLIAGAPTAAGTSAFTVQALDTGGRASTQDLSILVNAVPQITNADVTDWTQGQGFDVLLQASAGMSPLSWSIAAGTLPAGLNLSADRIQGTPSATGASAYAVAVTDACGVTDTLVVTQIINDLPQVQDAPPADGMVDEEYVWGLAAELGTPPFTWALQSGALPDGLTLSAAHGFISGTPTTDQMQSFTVVAMDVAGAAATRGFSIAVHTAPTNDANTFQIGVTSAAPDTTPPVLTGLGIAPATAAAGESVLISATATDDVSGVAAVTVETASPSGAYQTTTAVTYSRGAGQHEGRLTLSTFAEPGVWTITRVKLTDEAGNAVEITSGALIAGATFTVTNSVWDDAPPVLQTLFFSPPSVAAGETTTLAATVSDDVSGVDYVHAVVAMPPGADDLLASLSYNAATDHFEAQVTVPATAATGVWHVTGISVRDVAGVRDDIHDGPAIDGASLVVTGGASSDTQPPTLDALCVAPSTAAEGDAITFHALASDDASGVTAAGVWLTGPSGASIFVDLFYRGATGLWKNQTTLPVPAQPGAWAVTNVRLLDGAGNEANIDAYALQGVTVLSPASYPPLASNTTIDVTNPSPPPGDTEAPVVTGVNVAPGAAAVGEGMRIYVAATDATGVSYLYARLRSPSGSMSFSGVNLYLNYATGLFEGTLNVTENYESGTWSVSGVDTRDTADNYGSVSYNALAALPVLDISSITSDASADNLEFAITNPGSTTETIPPVILGVNIAPGSATAGEGVRIYGAAADADSGVTRMTVRLRDSTGNQNAGYVTLYPNPSTGFFEGTFEITAGHAPGVWTILDASASDGVGNGLFVEGPAVDALPPLDISSVTAAASSDNMAFTVVTSPPVTDTTPPQITGIALAPSAAAVGEGVRVFAEVTDDDSGVIYVSATLRGPDDPYPLVSAWMRLHPVSGLWEGTLTVPDAAATGLWSLSRVYANDAAGNTASVMGDQIATLATLDVSGVTDPIVKTTTVTISGSQAAPPVTDATPPVIGSLAVAPAAVDAGAGVWFVADVSDDDSGVRSVWVRLTSPGDGYLRSAGLELNPATGFYEGGLTVPLISEDGTWRVTRIDLTDNVYNAATILEADAFLAASPVEVTVSNAQSPPPPPTDSTAPVIASLTAAPGSVDAGDGVWFAADVDDNDSGVGEVRVTLKSPTDAHQVIVYLYYNPATQLYEEGKTIPLDKEDGVWRVTQIHLRDNAGNTATIDEADAFLQTSPVEVTVANTQVIPPPADTDPPVITNICIAPGAVNAGEKIWVMAEVTDDDTGVDYVSVTVKSPTDAYSCPATLYLNPANGRYEGHANVPLISEDGVWRITRIYLEDKAGNSDTINEGDPFLP